MMPMKGIAKNTSGVQDDNDDFDNDVSMALSLAERRSQPFKVEIPKYNATIDAES